MIQSSIIPQAPASVESVLREELVHGDAMLGTIAPILRHLLANDDHSVFGDEIIARVRGVTGDIARQLLDAAGADQSGPPAEQVDSLAAALVEVPGFLSHIHALALEWQLIQRLQARLALDPVLSPLLQNLIASSEAATSSLAMNLLAAQARFCQAQKRMKLSIVELPGDLLYGALEVFRARSGETDAVSSAVATIRERYDESCSRLGLAARLVMSMGAGAVAALSITHAGASLFLSALSIATGQNRDLTVLSTNEAQLARLALALRAAGLKPQAIEEQFLALHPDVALPEGFENLGSDRAAALLASGSGYALA